MASANCFLVQKYLFGKKQVAHSFCPVCGTSIAGFAQEGTQYQGYVGLNVSFQYVVTLQLNAELEKRMCQLTSCLSC